MNKRILILMIPLAFYSLAAKSDEVTLDDLIVNGDDDASVCLGNECIDGEIFDFDTVKHKTNDPTIKFKDARSSSSFPTNDWPIGITDNGAPDATKFLLKDLRAATTVLLMEAGANGGIALGSGSTIETAVISVGSTGSERQIVNVAEGLDNSDALNNNFATELAVDRTALDKQLSNLKDNIDSLLSRLDEVIDQLN